MSVNREVALKEIADIPMPDGKTLAEADIVRAFNVDGGTIRFVLEVADLRPPAPWRRSRQRRAGG